MKITAVTPQKKHPDRCNIFIDGNFAFGVGMVDAAAFKLTEGRELTGQEYDRITNELVFIRARDDALKYLGFKRRTKKEVRDKLKDDYNNDVIARVTELLERYRIIDDAEYAKLYVRDCLKFKGWGKRRIMTELTKRGISEELALPYFENTDELLLQKAEKLIEKRVKTPTLEPKDYKKHMDFLLRRGFDYQTAKTALSKYNMEET